MAQELTSAAMCEPASIAKSDAWSKRSVFRMESQAYNWKDCTHTTTTDGKWLSATSDAYKTSGAQTTSNWWSRLQTWSSAFWSVSKPVGTASCSIGDCVNKHCNTNTSDVYRSEYSLAPRNKLVRGKKSTTFEHENAWELKGCLCESAW